MRVSGAMTMRLGRSRSPMRTGVKRGWTDMTVLLGKGSSGDDDFAACSPASMKRGRQQSGREVGTYGRNTSAGFFFGRLAVLARLLHHRVTPHHRGPRPDGVEPALHVREIVQRLAEVR